jgi:hypothetical protein
MRDNGAASASEKALSSKGMLLLDPFPRRRWRSLFVCRETARGLGAEIV